MNVCIRDQNSDQDDDENGNRADDFECDMDELRSTVITDATMARVKALLVSTVDYRSKLTIDRATDLRRILPYFHTHSALVSVFYSI